MRRVKAIMILFVVMVMSARAQEVTDAQRRKALDMASEFCNLLSQFSSGKSAFLGNDERIFNLCSSPKITAYDDIVGNKEDILATYLINITHDYHNDLPMVFSKPVEETSFALPEFGYGYGDDTYGFKLGIAGYVDTYIIVSFTQTIPSLNKTTARKLIYSCNEDKIISFGNGDSPFVSYNKALQALANKDYESALVFVEKALKHGRYDGHLSCYTFAAIISNFLGDYDRIIAYASKIRERKLASFMLGSAYLRKNDFVNAVKYMEEAARLGYENAYFMLGIAYYHPESGHVNIQRSKEYFLKAINSQDVTVKAMSAYLYSIIALADQQRIQLDMKSIIGYLKMAGECGYVLAYLPLAVLYEKEGDLFESAYWSLLAVDETGSHLAMAMLGKYYLSSSKKETVKEGIDLLKRSVEYDTIDKELVALGEQCGLVPMFPKSNDDVKHLLQKYNQ